MGDVKIKMITWIRPSGREITAINTPATDAYAKSAGWKKKTAKTTK